MLTEQEIRWTPTRVRPLRGDSGALTYRTLALEAIAELAIAQREITRLEACYHSALDRLNALRQEWV